MNFVLDGETIVFRSDYGTKYRLGVLGEKPVSFEVDFLEPGRPSGWSVLVQGTTEEVDPGWSQRRDLESWAGGEKGRWVRITAESITGRRIHLPDASAGG